MLIKILKPILTKILCFVDLDADVDKVFVDLDADDDNDFVFLLILMLMLTKILLFDDLDADVAKEIVFFVSGSSVHLIFWQGCPPVDEDCRRKPKKVRGVGSQI